MHIFFIFHTDYELSFYHEILNLKLELFYQEILYRKMGVIPPWHSESEALTEILNCPKSEGTKGGVGLGGYLLPATFESPGYDQEAIAWGWLTSLCVTYLCHSCNGFIVRWAKRCRHLKKGVIEPRIQHIHTNNYVAATKLSKEGIVRARPKGYDAM
jgi:hypothetical protein